MNDRLDSSHFEPTEPVQLGDTGVKVTRLGIGTNPLAGLMEGISYETATATVEAAWDEGVRFYDMAPLYGYGFAERFVGDVLREHPRDAYALTTKVGRLILEEGPAERCDRMMVYEGVPRYKDTADVRPYYDYTYDGVMRSLEASRERSGIGRFDIVHIHDPELYMDEAAEEAYRALDDLRHAGEIGAIGVGSNNWDCHLELLGRGDYDAILLAGRYTLLDQSALPKLMPLCEDRGVAVIAAGVFNSGILAHPEPGSIGRIDRQASAMGTWKDNVTFDYDPAPPEIIRKAAAIKAVCDRHGVPLAAAAVQFPLHHPAVPAMVIGPRAPEHVATNNEFMRFPIPDDLWAELKYEGLLREEAPTP
ncbi:MAG: aldo/keto reductase [Chloroflexota bacterium]|nr:aldo/keto reductase [Chloroflexota bacterium]